MGVCVGCPPAPALATYRTGWAWVQRGRGCSPGCAPLAPASTAAPDSPCTLGGCRGRVRVPHSVVRPGAACGTAQPPSPDGPALVSPRPPCPPPLPLPCLCCAGMDKMLVSPDGDVTITNDGATILAKMQVRCAAAPGVEWVGGRGFGTGVCACGCSSECGLRCVCMRMRMRARACVYVFGVCGWVGGAC
jgi:hypothetical protein